jgi:hypothetical protein
LQILGNDPPHALGAPLCRMSHNCGKPEIVPDFSVMDHE